MTTRTISQIESATNERVGAFKIKNVLPSRQLRQIDPFLLIHHLQPTVIKPGGDWRIPPHPHAGFEVMTYLLDGEFFHRDSKGNDQVAKAGELNWMTSGAGIVHSEGPTESFLKKGGGLVQLLQVWINLPAAQKKSPSTFHHYSADLLPIVEKENCWTRVILGSYEGRQSPVDTHTPMFFWHLKAKEGERVSLPVDRDHEAALYVMSGKMKVLKDEVEAGQLVHFHSDGDQVSLEIIGDADLIFLGGLPIKEKVVSYGPFVMNSFEEIQGAIGDYEHGKMGVLDY